MSLCRCASNNRSFSISLSPSALANEAMVNGTFVLYIRTLLNNTQYTTHNTQQQCKNKLSYVDRGYEIMNEMPNFFLQTVAETNGSVENTYNTHTSTHTYIHTTQQLEGSETREHKMTNAKSRKLLFLEGFYIGCQRKITPKIDIFLLNLSVLSGIWWQLRLVLLMFCLLFCWLLVLLLSIYIHT